MKNFVLGVLGVALCVVPFYFGSVKTASAIPASVGFRAYSTASTVLTTCTVVAGTSYNDTSFNADTVTMFNLGTKGTGSFTTANNTDYKINCFKGSDGSAAAAKIFFNASEANFFSLSSFLLGRSK